MKNIMETYFKYDYN